jgi:small subunit ribosomal protein S16
LAVVIRLARKGHTHLPFYRITVADSRSPVNGKFLQQIGHYDPNQNPPVVQVDEESALKWLKTGAQPSDTVRGLLQNQGLLEKAYLMEKGAATPETPAKVRLTASKARTKRHKKAPAPVEAPAAAE